MREKLASRLGFILLSAGCAIGLGNVWRFPYIAGQNGGGLFVVLFLLFLLLIGLPVLTMEFAAGRAAQISIVRLHEVLTPDKKGWRLHGFVGMAGNVLLMMFYTTVTGWMLIYFIKMVTGSFAGLSPAEIGAAFGGVVSDPVLQIVAMLAVVLCASGVCAIGLQKGLERVTKVMMLCLLVLIIVLAANSVRLDGAMKGVEFYLIPNFARMKAVGVAKVVVEAMNHAFFTLSLGIGSMAIFGSYMDKRRTLLSEAVNVCLLDTFVALTAGLVIIPACFAFDIEAGQGPGLVFVTLPNVFNCMPGGRFWGSVFFLFLSMAALTTVLAVFENILATLRDLTGLSRGKACAVLAVGIPILSLPCIFGFNVWSDFHPFGEGSCVLDLEDFLVSTLILPFGGLAFSLYCCHRFGWGWENWITEVNLGTGIRLKADKIGLLRAYCAYVLPTIILIIFLVGLLERFKIIRL